MHTSFTGHDDAPPLLLDEPPVELLELPAGSPPTPELLDEPELPPVPSLTEGGS